MQILINHTSDLIIQFEVFRDIRGIDFSKKCMDVSCCVELVSDISTIAHSAPHSVRALTTMAKRLVYLFNQKTVGYSESGHYRFLFTVDCFGSIAQTLF